MNPRERLNFTEFGIVDVYCEYLFVGVMCVAAIPMAILAIVTSPLALLGWAVKRYNRKTE